MDGEEEDTKIFNMIMLRAERTVRKHSEKVISEKNQKKIQLDRIVDEKTIAIGD